MGYGAVAFPIILVALAVIAWRRSRDWFFLLVGTLAALAAAGVFASAGPSIDDLPRDLVAAVLLCVFTVWAFGLPAPLARRIGWGLRDPEREFDTRLTRELRALNQLFDEEPTPESGRHARWTPHARSRGAKIVRRMGRLRAPDERWDELVRGYVDAYSAILADIGRSTSAEETSRVRARFDAVCERHAALREARFAGGRARPEGQPDSNLDHD